MVSTVSSPQNSINKSGCSYGCHVLTDLVTFVKFWRVWLSDHRLQYSPPSFPLHSFSVLSKPTVDNFRGLSQLNAAYYIRNLWYPTPFSAVYPLLPFLIFRFFLPLVGLDQWIHHGSSNLASVCNSPERCAPTAFEAWFVAAPGLRFFLIFSYLICLDLFYSLLSGNHPLQIISKSWDLNFFLHISLHFCDLSPNLFSLLWRPFCGLASQAASPTWPPFILLKTAGWNVYCAFLSCMLHALVPWYRVGNHTKFIESMN